MLLKFGGPYFGHTFGDIREFSEEEGAQLVHDLGPDRVEVIGDLRAPSAAEVAKAREQEEFDAALAAEDDDDDDDDDD